MSKATHTPGPTQSSYDPAYYLATQEDLLDALPPVYRAAPDLLETLLESRSIGDRLARGIAVSRDEIRAANARQTAAIQKATGGQS